MPFELRCPGCQKLLRVADEHAGREARCPNCSAVFTAMPLAADASPSPFTHLGSPEGSVTTNPYASPSTYADPTPRQESLSKWSPRQISYDEVFSKSWAIFKKQWLMICVAVLVVGGINIGISLVQNVIMMVLTAATNEAVVTFLSQIVMGLIAWVFQTWLGIGRVMVILDIARGREINIGKLFAGGPFLINTLLAEVIVISIISAILLVLIGIPAAAVGLAMQDVKAVGIAAMIGAFTAFVPIIVITLMFSQIQLLIVDRGLSAVGSLQTSLEITSGNKLTIFLIGILLFAIGICAAIAGLLAICIGFIPAMIGVAGFGALIFVVTYLCMTNQPVAVPGN